MGMASMSRMIFTAVGVCMLAFPAGCVMHEIYGGSAVPESELAFVEGYWHFRVLYDEELHIVSVDGKREGESSGWPYAYSISLPSGKHWLQLAILRNSGVVAWCAFEWTFEAQHRYKLERLDHDQFLLAHPGVFSFRGLNINGSYCAWSTSSTFKRASSMRHTVNVPPAFGLPSRLLVSIGCGL